MKQGDVNVKSFTRTMILIGIAFSVIFVVINWGWIVLMFNQIKNADFKGAGSYETQVKQILKEKYGEEFELSGGSYTQFPVNHYNFTGIPQKQQDLAFRIKVYPREEQDIWVYDEYAAGQELYPIISDFFEDSVCVKFYFPDQNKAINLGDALNAELLRNRIAFSIGFQLILLSSNDKSELDKIESKLEMMRKALEKEGFEEIIINTIIFDVDGIKSRAEFKEDLISNFNRALDEYKKYQILSTDNYALGGKRT